MDGGVRRGTDVLDRARPRRPGGPHRPPAAVGPGLRRRGGRPARPRAPAGRDRARAPAARRADARGRHPRPRHRLSADRQPRDHEMRLVEELPPGDPDHPVALRRRAPHPAAGRARTPAACREWRSRRPRRSAAPRATARRPRSGRARRSSPAVGSPAFRTSARSSLSALERVMPGCSRGCGAQCGGSASAGSVLVDDSSKGEVVELLLDLRFLDRPLELRLCSRRRQVTDRPPRRRDPKPVHPRHVRLRRGLASWTRTPRLCAPVGEHGDVGRLAPATEAVQRRCGAVAQRCARPARQDRRGRGR